MAPFTVDQGARKTDADAEFSLILNVSHNPEGCLFLSLLRQSNNRANPMNARRNR